MGDVFPPYNLAIELLNRRSGRYGHHTAVRTVLTHPFDLPHTRTRLCPKHLDAHQASIQPGFLNVCESPRI